MKKSLQVITLSSLTLTPAFGVVVALEDWQFNTLGDVEGWNATQAANFTVRAAINGTETVASAGTDGSDPKFQHPDDITLPVDSSWHSFEFRFRQLNDDPTAVGVGALTPYEENGTIVFFEGLTGGNVGSIPEVTPGVGPYTINVESDGWRTVTVSMSGVSGTTLDRLRMDLVGSANLGYEVDYATLYISTIPEPSTYACMLGMGALGGVLILRRRKQMILDEEEGYDQRCC